MNSILDITKEQYIVYMNMPQMLSYSVNYHYVSINSQLYTVCIIFHEIRIKSVAYKAGKFYTIEHIFK